MKRFPPAALLMLVMMGIFVPLALAATGTAPAKTSDHSPGSALAGTVSTVTGIAISPLLGTGVYGAYQWFAAKGPEARQALPWFAQWTFWVPALLVVGVCAAKDSFGSVVPPGLKKPLDVLETLENKMSGLVAAGAVVPITMSTLSKMLVASDATHSVLPTGLAMLPLGMGTASSFLNVLTVPFGVAMFAVVWMASHAINVLILLSPWGAVDAALKAARTALLGLLTLSATINPWVGAALSLVTILVAYLVAGWAFRLTVFGSVFCWDFLTLRRARFTPNENENWMFAGGNLPGVPVRTYGRLVARAEGGCDFAYRPWFWLPVRVTPVPADRSALSVGRGLFFSSITGKEDATLFLLPPRYRGHEDSLVRIYEMGGGVQPAGLRKAWGVVRELFGGGAAKTQVD